MRLLPGDQAVHTDQDRNETRVTVLEVVSPDQAIVTTDDGLALKVSLDTLRPTGGKA